MTRITFTSPDACFELSRIPEGVFEKGIRTHSRIGAIIRNFFALIGLCSRVFEYKVRHYRKDGKQINSADKAHTIYLNLASYNNWLKRYNVSELTRSEIQSENMISAKISEVISAQSQSSSSSTTSSNSSATSSSSSATSSSSSATSHSGAKRAGPDVF